MARILLVASILFAIALAQPTCPRVNELGELDGNREFSYCITPRKGSDGEVFLNQLFNRLSEFTTEVDIKVRDCFEVSVLFDLLGNLNLGNLGGSSSVTQKRDPEVIALLRKLDRGVICKPVASHDLWSFNPRRQSITFPREACNAQSLQIVQEILGSTIFQIVKLLLGNDIIATIPFENIDEITKSQVNTVMDFLAGCVRVYDVRIPVPQGCRPVSASFVVPSSAQAINFEVESCVNGNGLPFIQEQVVDNIGDNIEGLVNALLDGDVDAGQIIDGVLDTLINGNEPETTTTTSTSTTGSTTTTTTTTSTTGSTSTSTTGDGPCCPPGTIACPFGRICDTRRSEAELVINKF